MIAHSICKAGEHTIAAVFSFLVPFSLIIIAVLVVVGPVYLFFRSYRVLAWGGVSLCLAAAGCSAGVLVGSSNNPIAGSVVSALIAGFGTIVGYFFSKDIDKKYLLYSPLLLMAFSVSLVFAAMYSSSVRFDQEMHLKEISLSIKQYENVNIPFFKRQLETALKAGTLDGSMILEFYGEQMAPSPTLLIDNCAS